ncbi:hypothetical protein BH23VER1_BH23VER1_12690 [soil metagenome]
MKCYGFVFAAVFVTAAVTAAVAGGRAAPPPPAATFSIVAYDEVTGELGVAVASRVVGVGAIVPFAKAGVGAVATQAWANVRFGPEILDRLERGETAEQAVRAVVEADPQRAERQVGAVDVRGGASVFTGRGCHPWASCRAGRHFVVQGNILAGPDVLVAMREAFEAADGVLAERLLAALEAGEQAGGDRRGKQAAALLVVRDGWGYGGLGDRFRDVRVDDHADPVTELRRVYQIHRKIFPRPER